MAVYLLVSEANYRVIRFAAIRKLCELFFEAFTPLQDVVLFAVNPHDAQFPGFIEYDIALHRTQCGLRLR